MSESLYSIAVLIDELKNEDPAVRLNSVRKLPDIARVLGPERTRNELMPYIQDSTDDEDIGAALAEEIGNLIDVIGGPNYGGFLVVPLETLGGVEEIAIRDKAMESLCKVIDRAPADVVTEHVVPAIKRMSGNEWFSSKAAVCSLFASAYPKAGGFKSELRSLYGELCCDDTPMVRRAAASNIVKFVKQVEKEYVKGEFVQHLNKLSHDEQDSVRLLCIEGCIAIGTILSQEENVSAILPIIRQCSSDKSWRVRYMVANHYHEVCKIITPENIKTELVPAFVKLLKDVEPEVKAAASSKVASFCSNLPPEVILKQIMSCVRELTGDPSQHVRASLASVIVALGAPLSRNVVIDNLLPLILQLLKDESSEVRLNVISKLDLMNQSVGLDLLSQSLLPAIVELAEDKQWRIRLAIIEQMPLLANLLGVRFFDEKFNNLCTSWLGDPVHAVREAATLNLKKLSESFGADWTRANVVPKILIVSQHPNYLYRMTTLLAIQTLFQTVTPDIVTSVFIPLLTKLTNDPVPNIRFNVAKTLQALFPSMDSATSQQMKALITRLMNDQDKDVAFFASQANQRFR